MGVQKVCQHQPKRVFWFVCGFMKFWYLKQKGDGNKVRGELQSNIVDHNFASMNFTSGLVSSILFHAIKTIQIYPVK